MNEAAIKSTSEREQAIPATATREWTWDAADAAHSDGTEEEGSDRVALLVGGELRRLYQEMRDLLNDAFDRCYPDPTPENQEEHFDRHVEWLDGFEGEFFDRMGAGWRLAKEGDRYVLTGIDYEQGKSWTIRLDTALSDEELTAQISEFVAVRDPLGAIKSRCAENVAQLLGE